MSSSKMPSQVRGPAFLLF